MIHSYYKNQKRLHFILFIYIILALMSCVRIKTFIPQGGQVGSEIEIIGSGFSTDITGNQVTFGGIAAEVLSASADKLIVRVPDGVARAKIKVSRGWPNSDESKTDFILLPEYLKYDKFRSASLSTTANSDIIQGYWIMYPPNFSENGKRFPIIYALHGYNFDRNLEKTDSGDLLAELGFLNIGANNEHSWIFAINRPGMYFPFIAWSMMKSNSIDELEAILIEQITPAVAPMDLDHVDEIVQSIIYYLPEDPNTWLPNLTDMITVMPDGDNSWYTDRLGPSEGRNEEGLGTESIYPRTESENPAERFDLHVSGWFERYIIQDLIEHIETEEIGLDKLVEEDKRRFITGISMGGYGCLKIALKHQDRFIAVASLSASPNLTFQNLNLINKLLPELLDVFGSAPLHFNASEDELEENVILDEEYIEQNNPVDIVDSMTNTDLAFFVEIGENDMINLVYPEIFSDVQEFINILDDKGISVTGGIVPAASPDEPDNGDANHFPQFWRTRFGNVIKFFSDVNEEL